MDIKKLIDEIGFERVATTYPGGELPPGRIDAALEKLKLLCEQDITSLVFAATMRDTGGQGDNSAPILVSMAGSFDEIMECMDALATNIERVLEQRDKENGD